MEVIKAGLLDTFQDAGRSHMAAEGIAAGGYMDSMAAGLALLLTGNKAGTTVLEMHYPAAQLRFHRPVILALSGADFAATVDDFPVALNRQVMVPAGATLSFTKRIAGQRVYLAVAGGWQIPLLAGSTSTHLSAGFGGWQGRALRKNDCIPLQPMEENPMINKISMAKWFVRPGIACHNPVVSVLPGPEFDWLQEDSKQLVFKAAFSVEHQSNRMGYRLGGPALQLRHTSNMWSSAVLPGTIQLLPNGKLLLLMADAQTTGGYPRVLQLCATHMPILAQAPPGTGLYFQKCTLQQARKQYIAMQQQMAQWRAAVHLKQWYTS